jgi:hypothetical protein
MSKVGDLTMSYELNRASVDDFYNAQAFAAHFGKDKIDAAIKPVDANLKTVAALHKPRLSDVPPVALFALGAAMSNGKDKYGRFNWRDTGTTSSVFYDAMQRHLAQWYSGEDFAEDSKVHHLAHIMASCAILMDSEFQGSLNDDRSYHGPSPLNTPLYWIEK